MRSPIFRLAPYGSPAVVINQTSSSDILGKNFVQIFIIKFTPITPETDLDDSNFAKLRVAILDKDRHHSDEDELISDEDMEQQSPTHLIQ